ncbi:transglutaminase domain-containing protein [Winogradskyella sp. 3972H.M.0a.05]|uniref:transglutaminase domain-containing protein n=1 Tax=Winogradskyella sp. 3972H.M.0a.05 TaxID=2950277 RepID=UPI003393EEDE
MKFLVHLLCLVFACHVSAQVSDFDHINFRKADSTALACKDEGLTNLTGLASRLTSNLDTDVERFRAIYIWVTSNIENDYGFFLKNKRKRKRYKNDSILLKNWNDRFKKDLFSKLLNNKKTICTGYAYLIKELSVLADINCTIVQGYAKTSTTNLDNLDTPNHSWNAVQLDGKWYLCDPTWSSGLINPDNNQFTFQYNNGYFLAEPRLFIKNHFPADTKWTLLGDDAPTFDDFLESPIIYGKGFSNLALHNTPKKMHNTVRKHETVTFEYKLHKFINTEDVVIVLDRGVKNRTIKPSPTIDKDNTLTIEFEFDQTGFYDVHLMIEDDYISTYTFNVKK